MSDDLKITAWVTGMVAAVLCTLIVSHNLYYSSVAKSAMENGFSQKTLPGQAGVYWVKD